MMFCLAQSSEGFRKRAMDTMNVMQYLQEFALVDDFSQLSDLFNDDRRLADAAVSSFEYQRCCSCTSLLAA